MAKKPAIQDGGMFYDESGMLLADYGYMVSHDYDMRGAGKARDRFKEEHPEYDLDFED